MSASGQNMDWSVGLFYTETQALQIWIGSSQQQQHLVTQRESISGRFGKDAGTARQHHFISFLSLIKIWYITIINSHNKSFMHCYSYGNITSSDALVLTTAVESGYLS